MNCFYTFRVKFGAKLLKRLEIKDERSEFFAFFRIMYQIFSYLCPRRIKNNLNFKLKTSIKL